MPKSFENLSIEELENIKKQQQQNLKKEYSDYKKKKQKLIADIKKIKNMRERIKTTKPQPKPKSKPKPQHKPKPKTFDDYFQECIKNKTIPPDTPSYFRKALERAIKEHEQGIVKEKSALEGFAKKYILKGKPGILPFKFFKSKSTYLKEFLRNHRNIKVRFVLVCLMEQMSGNGKLSITIRDKAYFQSDTHINLGSTDVKKILAQVIHTTLEKISIYQNKGSGWSFKEVVHLEIHAVKFNPARGSSYIPLRDWIMRKKATVNIRNTDDKCFLWCVVRYLNPKLKNDDRLTKREYPKYRRN